MINRKFFTIILTLIFLLSLGASSTGFFTTKVEALDQPTVMVTPASSNTDTISVTFSQAIPAGNIIDVELHDTNNQKVWQDFTSAGGTTFTTKASSPLNYGVYSIHVGLFTQNWQSMYTWFSNVGTITIGNNINTASIASNQPSPTPTQAPTTPVVSTDPTLFNAAQTAYNDWKNKYVTGANGGLRVTRPENNNDTVSEGMGYGMMLSVFAGDKGTFDGLWSYTQQHLDGKGLMNWQIDSNGNTIGSGAATDADEDIAYALLIANKQWAGNRYDNGARRMIQAMEANEVSSSNIVTPGDMWGNTQDTNPSYMAISDYRAFAKFTGDNRWNDIANANMQLLSRAANQNTGLVPDWIKNDLSQTTDTSWDKYPNGFYYDALRNPIRMLLTYKSNADGAAQNMLQKQAAFFGSVGADKLVAGYTLSGSPLTNYMDSAFMAAYAAAGQVNPSSDFAKAEMQKLISTPPSGYFGTSLRAITLFISAGSGMY